MIDVDNLQTFELEPQLQSKRKLPNRKEGTMGAKSKQKRESMTTKLSLWLGILSSAILLLGAIGAFKTQVEEVASTVNTLSTQLAVLQNDMEWIKAILKPKFASMQEAKNAGFVTETAEGTWTVTDRGLQVLGSALRSQIRDMSAEIDRVTNSHKNHETHVDILITKLFEKHTFLKEATQRNITVPEFMGTILAYAESEMAVGRQSDGEK